MANGKLRRCFVTSPCRMANGKLRRCIATSPCRMAVGKLRSSGTMVAPHRATMQLSPQGEIAAREGVGITRKSTKMGIGDVR